ncbi:MAG: hypothetical protein HY400_03800 [Elusimicrobia bacterium]|nr:hypothetical protein [Elusimicrobiota bacterium]
MFHAKWIRILLLGFAGAGCVYGLVYVDLILRAKSAYGEGEKYFRWHEHPEEKKIFYERQLSSDKQNLEEELKAGRLTQEGFQEKMELIRVRFEHEMEESSIKYATLWYQTAAELFSPPESKWVKLSREKMAVARELWRKELRSRGISFQEYMLE